MYKTLLIDKKETLLTITLNRPDLRNAFNDELIAELAQAFKKEADKSVRAILIKGSGKAFCAGGDLNWMQKCAHTTKKQNIADAKKLFCMLETVNRCPKPVVAQVHGAALGGGMGLVAACDYVIASQETLFGFTEARLGLIPATIGPFVIAKIGESWARALFLSAERFEAKKAFSIGLIHQVVEDETLLQQRINSILFQILELSPLALATAKKFIGEVQKKKGAAQQNYAAQTLASLRASQQGQEGIAAFLEKRKPNWNH